MAKNTLSSTFRKLDIDQYNDDLYVEESGGESAEIAHQGPDEAEVNALLNGILGIEQITVHNTLIYVFSNTSKAEEALKVVLRNAPINAKGFDVKDKAFALAMKCMLAIRTSEMEALVQSLDRELIDTLMKYIYRGFESPSEGSSGHLLAWHEKAFAHGGLGSIIRVMTARKTV